MHAQDSDELLRLVAFWHFLIASPSPERSPEANTRLENYRLGTWNPIVATIPASGVEESWTRG